MFVKLQASALFASPCVLPHSVSIFIPVPSCVARCAVDVWSGFRPGTSPGQVHTFRITTRRPATTGCKPSPSIPVLRQRSPLKTTSGGRETSTSQQSPPTSIWSRGQYTLHTRILLSFPITYLYLQWGHNDRWLVLP